MELYEQQIFLTKMWNTSGVQGCAFFIIYIISTSNKNTIKGWDAWKLKLADLIILVEWAPVGKNDLSSNWLLLIKNLISRNQYY